ncbi:MAG TPA: exodeoxyribonuclease VII small subunit [Candidatus Saccharimonadales bacterium]|jgi:exodeoxyribonuclease VII small subunit
MTKSRTAPASDASQPDYTELSQELAVVMEKLEQGGLDVDAAVACYDRGLQIVALLEAHLLHAENRVSELKATLGDLDDASEEE